MKVYLIGSHATGKTTLARHISQQFQLPMIAEVARVVLAENEYQLDTLRADLSLVDSYQEQVYHRQILEEAKYDSFVSDRSILDILAYSGQHPRILPKLIAKPETIQYLTGLRAPDSILFFVRPTKATLQPDGVREIPN